jgi:protocatechuate 3,4-dioxygenase beta subunit
MNRHISQIFFPGEPLNKVDLLLNGIADPEARERVIFQPAPAADPRRALGFRRDFVLRGKHRTPELD